MPARLLLRERLVLTEATFVDLRVWQVPRAVRGSVHDLKYSLALIADGVCVLRYDNEAGKGDHKHVDGREVSYRFVSLQALQADFWSDVEAWRRER
jgi:hypothetical protein